MENNKVLNVFEGFSGYGGGSSALKNISKKHKKFKYNDIGCLEVDNYIDE